MHKHHIIPRHLGGSNRPDNLVEVSIEEHARIHHSLWILGGRWQDELAWKVLSGQIGGEEATRLAASRANIGNKNASRANIGNKNASGKRTPEQKNLMSQRQKVIWSNPEHRRKMSEAHKGQIPWNKKQ